MGLVAVWAKKCPTRMKRLRSNFLWGRSRAPRKLFLRRVFVIFFEAVFIC